MKKFLMKKRGQKGFTLMEMLIVVAIIAILVVIAIPIFNSSLSNAKTQADAANIRAAKAVATVTYLENGAAIVDQWFDPASGTLKASKTQCRQTAPTTNGIKVSVTSAGVVTVLWAD